MTSSTENRNEQIRNYPPIDPASIPSAAQLQKQRVDAKLQFQEYLKNMNYRIRAVELAAQFKSDDPMKLAKDIYKFLSDTEI